MPYVNLSLVHSVIYVMNKGIFPFVVTSYERDLEGHHIHCSCRLRDEVWARERGRRQMQSVWWICPITAWTIAEERGSRWAYCCEFTQNLMSPICHLCIQEEFCHWLERQQNKAQYQTSSNVISACVLLFVLRATNPPVTKLAHALVSAPQEGKPGLRRVILCSKMTAAQLDLEKYPSHVMTLSSFLTRSGLITGLPSCPENKT